MMNLRKFFAVMGLASPLVMMAVSLVIPAAVLVLGFIMVQDPVQFGRILLQALFLIFLLPGIPLPGPPPDPLTLAILF